MQSIIYFEEVVRNKERKFGSQNFYYPAKVCVDDGSFVNALFTIDQINVATERAERNPEDLPERKTFWENIFGAKE